MKNRWIVLLLCFLVLPLLASCLDRGAGSSGESSGEITVGEAFTSDVPPDTSESVTVVLPDSTETTDTVSEESDTTVPVTSVVESETQPLDMEFRLEMPSEELQERFVQEYVAYRGLDPEDYPAVNIGHWLGSFGDIHFLDPINDGVTYPAMGWGYVVAGYRFFYPDGTIQVWVDGQFLEIDDAYEKKLITGDMVARIANVYNCTDGRPIKVKATKDLMGDCYETSN